MLFARVVELADSLDSGSSAHYGRAGSSPASRTKKQDSLLAVLFFCCSGWIRRESDETRGPRKNASFCGERTSSGASETCRRAAGRRMHSLRGRSPASRTKKDSRKTVLFLFSRSSPKWVSFLFMFPRRLFVDRSDGAERKQQRHTTMWLCVFVVFGMIPPGILLVSAFNAGRSIKKLPNSAPALRRGASAPTAPHADRCPSAAHSAAPTASIPAVPWGADSTHRRWPP